MNFLLRVVVLVIAGMVLVFLGVGMLLPSRWQVDNALVMAVPPEKVMAVVGDLGTWREWSTFQATLGPRTDYRVEGAAGVVGQRAIWTGAQGQAVLTLVRVDPASVGYDFELQLTGESAPHRQGRGTITVSGKDAGCVVAWRDEQDLDAMALRWFAWFGAVQEAVRRIQQTSLTGLQQRLEPGSGNAGSTAR